ncbi:MAG TPA: hypothetical protein VE110_10590, partial [Gemmatimonadaceae bacterium]|nr:hypothetical protein [Gemmatimonadaceae bacterium]
MRRISGSIAALFLATGVMSCGGGGGDGGGIMNPPPPTCDADTFCMGSQAFFTVPATQPVTLSVAANTPVTWDNNSFV